MSVLQRFAHRARTPELMDVEECGFEEFRACLVDLATVNRLTRTYAPTLGFLERLWRSGRLDEAKPLRVLDVGSGYGDMLRRIAGWGRRRGVALELAGLDLNPWSAQAAREATPTGVDIRWVTGDLFDHVSREPVDIVLSAQFAHHLHDEALVRFFAWMEATAQIGWLVSDLHRHPLPYHVFKWLARAARWHRFVQHDGPLSIRRGFRQRELRRLAESAGLGAAVRLRWHVPFRLTVERVRT